MALDAPIRSRNDNTTRSPTLATELVLAAVVVVVTFATAIVSRNALQDLPNDLAFELQVDGGDPERALRNSVQDVHLFGLTLGLGARF